MTDSLGNLTTEFESLRQESTGVNTRSSGSQLYLLPTVPWDRREGKRGLEERKQIGNRKYARVKTRFV